MKSTRKGAQISGEIQLQFSLTDSSDPATPVEQISQKWQLFMGSFIRTPPSEEENLDQQLGEAGIELEDEEDDSSEADESKSDEGSQAGKAMPIKGKKDKVKKNPKQTAYEFSHGTDVVGVVYLEVSKITDLPPLHNSMYIRVREVAAKANITLASDPDWLRHGPVCGCVSGKESLSYKACTALTKPCLL